MTHLGYAVEYSEITGHDLDREGRNHLGEVSECGSSTKRMCMHLLMAFMAQH